VNQVLMMSIDKSHNRRQWEMEETVEMVGRPRLERGTNGLKVIDTKHKLLIFKYIYKMGAHCFWRI